MSQPTNDPKPAGYPVKSAIGFALFVGAALLICDLLNSYSEVRQTPQTYLTVCTVEADPTIPGRAYAQLGKLQPGCPPDWITTPNLTEYPLAAVYETNDYGQNWLILKDVPPEWNQWRRPQSVVSLTFEDGNVKYQGQTLWSLPRPAFTALFSSSDDLYTRLHDSAAPAGQGVLYVALGRYGVLVGPNPAEGSARPWQLIQTYFAGLNPNAFRLTDPHIILWVISLLLGIPPLPLIHAWLLNQVWRYMAPFDEQRRILRLAVGVAIATSALIAIGAAFWLYNADADLLSVGGIVTAFAVIIGVVVAVWAARRRQFTDSFTRKLGVVTGLVSLIVPVAAFAAPLTSSANAMIWVVGLLLIFGFIAYRRALGRYLDKLESRVTLWQTDRLAFEILALFLLMLLPIAVLIAFIEWLLANVHFAYGVACFATLFACLLPVIGIPLLGALGLRLYTRWRGRDWVIKKKASPLELHTTPLFAGNDWFRLLFWHTAIWLITTSIAVALYAGILSEIKTRLLSGL